MRPGMMLALSLVMACVVPAWAGMEEGAAAYERGDYAAALPHYGNGSRWPKKAIQPRRYCSAECIWKDGAFRAMPCKLKIWSILAIAPGNRTAETLRGKHLGP